MSKMDEELRSISAITLGILSKHSSCRALLAVKISINVTDYGNIHYYVTDFEVKGFLII